jgi:hypothetical protein
LAGHLNFRYAFNLAIKAASKTAKVAKRSWRAALEAGFPFSRHRHPLHTCIGCFSANNFMRTA